MRAADVIRHFPGIFEINGVSFHTYGKSTYRLSEQSCGDGTDKRTVEPAAEQESDGSIGIQTLFHAGDQLVVNFSTNFRKRIMRDLRHLCDVPVADELSVRIVVTGRKRKNFIGKANQINRFAGKKNFPILLYP